MARTLYLVNTRSDFPTYFSAEVFAARGFRPATYMADLAIPTIARLAEPFFDVALCDENLTAIDLDCGADIVGLTGKITQLRRMIEVAAAFRARGATVVVGGPCASLSPELLRPHCDVLVRGEIEEIGAQLFSDLRDGSSRDEYVGTKVDLARSPLPLWDGYPSERALSGTVQTSRGCPFDCEFCDVIQYLGRKQRHKPIDRVLAELDALYERGWRSVFIADDNFTAHRPRTKELLDALAWWNDRRDEGPVRFITQASIDAARDDELLALCGRAGLRQVFVGLETPNEESLRETRKRQNLRVDLVREVERFVAHGITVYGGMIVGFDHDGPDIFERQHAFASAMPIPVYSLGALVAPAATPLHDRMVREGRLLDGPEVAAMPWSTNIRPARMSRDEVLAGLRSLCNRLYDPEAFGDRIELLLDGLRGSLPPQPRSRSASQEPLLGDLRALVAELAGMGSREASLVERVVARLAEQREARYYVLAHLVQYAQIRHMYAHAGLWDGPENAAPRRLAATAAG